MLNNASLIKKDKEFVWHPFTQEKLAPSNIPIVKGKDSWIYDADGKAYLDVISSWWVNVHGHSNKYINKALKSQAEELEHIIFAGFTHPKGIELAERIITKLGGHFKKAFYSDNGSTSNEVALKMAFQYFYNKGEEKTKVIALNGSYHGDTFGVMSTATRNEFNAPFAPNLFDVFHISAPTEENFEQVFAQFKELILNNDVAAFVFEPLVMGVAGMQMYSKECLEKLIAFCKENDVLTIADEVFVGFYRTGKMFAIDYLSIQPDIICLSKGLTGGYLPLGLTATTQKVYDSFYSDDRLKTFFHGHSYTGNPLSCSVACASLDLFEQNETVQNIENIVQWNLKFAQELKYNKHTENVRTLGTILAFDVITKEEINYFNTIRDNIYDYFMDKNLMIRPLGNTIYITPPYCFTKEEFAMAKTGILDFLKTLD